MKIVYFNTPGSESEMGLDADRDTNPDSKYSIQHARSSARLIKVKKDYFPTIFKFWPKRHARDHLKFILSSYHWGSEK